MFIQPISFFLLYLFILTFFFFGWWLRGPGCSSELALAFENGPFQIDGNGNKNVNAYSWNTFANLCMFLICYYFHWKTFSNNFFFLDWICSVRWSTSWNWIFNLRRRLRHWWETSCQRHVGFLWGILCQIPTTLEQLSRHHRRILCVSF